MTFLIIFIYAWFGIAVTGIIVSAIIELLSPLKKNKYNKNLCLSCKHLERYSPKEASSKYKCYYRIDSFSHPAKYCKFYIDKEELKGE